MLLWHISLRFSSVIIDSFGKTIKVSIKLDNWAGWRGQRWDSDCWWPLIISSSPENVKLQSCFLDEFSSCIVILYVIPIFSSPLHGWKSFQWKQTASVSAYEYICGLPNATNWTHLAGSFWAWAWSCIQLDEIVWPAPIHEYVYSSNLLSFEGLLGAIYCLATVFQRDRTLLVLLEIRFLT